MPTARPGALDVSVTERLVDRMGRLVRTVATMLDERSPQRGAAGGAATASVPTFGRRRQSANGSPREERRTAAGARGDSMRRSLNRPPDFLIAGKAIPNHSDYYLNLSKREDGGIRKDMATTLTYGWRVT